MSVAALNKSARFRQRMRERGLRPVQFWVPDTRAPEFQERIRQQCLALREDPEEADAMRMIEEAALLVEGWEWGE